MTTSARSLLAILALISAFSLTSAEEKPVTGFSLIIEGGLATFRLADHILFFREGERAEESVKLTDEQVARALLLLNSNPMLAVKFAKKPADKVFMEIHVVRAGGATDDRYLTMAEGEALNKEIEEKVTASGDDPKVLEQLDNQIELFPYLFSLTTASKPPRR